MFMPKKNRIAIYSYLFKGAFPRPLAERPSSAARARVAPRHLSALPDPRPTPALRAEGVLTCQKDVKLQKHHELDLPNLHVVKAMLSLKSRGHVREVFNWQWHYYFLTDTGIEYLKGYLHLPEDVVPATLKRAPGAPGGESAGAGGGFGERRTFGERRKDDAPAGGFRPSFGGAA